MKISIISIGRFKNGFEKEFFNTYQTRLYRWPLSLIEITHKKNLAIPQQKTYEAELIKEKLSEKSFLIALDEHGVHMPSEKFAYFMKDTLEKNPHITFLIGGAHGLDASLLGLCAKKIALSAMTWPHMVVRGMLAEQLYRASSILDNHPYHKA